MATRSITRLVAAAVVASGTLLGVAVNRAAADTIDFPEGLVCAFPLNVVGTPDTRTLHEFKDASGSVVRTLQTGRGSDLTLTNVDTGAHLSLSASGAVWNIVTHPDESKTFTSTGHLVLFLFPTDVPAGPSTTLYVGRVVFDIDTNGVFTLKETRGTATDLCAALSS